MESMKANSASTCSCSQGSRFALSCNSDSPATSSFDLFWCCVRRRCLPFEFGEPGRHSWAACATFQGFDPGGEIARLYGASLELNDSGHCLALLGNMTPVATADT